MRGWLILAVDGADGDGGTAALVAAILVAAVSALANVLQALRSYRAGKKEDDVKAAGEAAKQKGEQRSEEVRSAQREFDYLVKRYQGVIEQQERRLGSIDERLKEQQAAEMKCREDLAAARADITHLRGQVADMGARIVTLEGGGAAS